jgi:regulator of replication initiation timing
MPFFKPQEEGIQEMSADYIKSKIKSATDKAHGLFNLAQSQLKERNSLEKKHNGPSVASTFLDKLGRHNSSVSDALYKKAHHICSVGYRHLRDQGRQTGALYDYEDKRGF